MGGVEDHRGHVEIVARGPIGVVSSILHHASAATGGVLLASRGPFPVEFLREHGAVGAVSACIRLGEAMIAAEGEGGEAMIARDQGHARRPRARPRAAARRERRRARELGRRHARGRQRLALVIHVCNEYMAADIDGERVATYPDLIVTLAESDGMPTPAAHREPGERIVVLAVPRDTHPARRGRARGRRLPRSRAAARHRARRARRRLVTAPVVVGAGGITPADVVRVARELATRRARARGRADDPREPRGRRARRQRRPADLRAQHRPRPHARRARAARRAAALPAPDDRGARQRHRRRRSTPRTCAPRCSRASAARRAAAPG